MAKSSSSSRAALAQCTQMAGSHAGRVDVAPGGSASQGPSLLEAPAAKATKRHMELPASDNSRPAKRRHTQEGCSQGTTTCRPTTIQIPDESHLQAPATPAGSMGEWHVAAHQDGRGLVAPALQEPGGKFQRTVLLQATASLGGLLPSLGGALCPQAEHDVRSGERGGETLASSLQDAGRPDTQSHGTDTRQSLPKAALQGPRENVPHRIHKSWERGRGGGGRAGAGGGGGGAGAGGLGKVRSGTCGVRSSVPLSPAPDRQLQSSPASTVTCGRALRMLSPQELAREMYLDLLQTQGGRRPITSISPAKPSPCKNMGEKVPVQGEAHGSHCAASSQVRSHEEEVGSPECPGGVSRTTFGDLWETGTESPACKEAENLLESLFSRGAECRQLTHSTSSRDGGTKLLWKPAFHRGDSRAYVGLNTSSAGPVRLQQYPGPSDNGLLIPLQGHCGTEHNSREAAAPTGTSADTSSGRLKPTGALGLKQENGLAR